MKNNISTTKHYSFSGIFKALGNALKKLFESGNNRDFKRLKDYISS
jgi:hypothetical protein